MVRIGKLLRKTTKRRIAAIVLSLLLLVTAVYSTYYVTSYLTMQIKESEYSAVAEKLASVSRNVYISGRDIKCGEIISTSDVSFVEALTDAEEEQLFDEADIGMMACHDIPTGTRMMKCMVTEKLNEEGIRETECKVIELSSNLENNDYVDVRLFLPNGEDYIVLSKKSIHDMGRKETETESIPEGCFFWLKEDEILMLSAAMVDAYLYEGASIYTTKYIDPVQQRASQISYVPSLATLQMIRDNPEILVKAAYEGKEGLRRALENRLAEQLSTDVADIVWDEAEEEIWE